jgi:hypothetical protein
VDKVFGVSYLNQDSQDLRIIRFLFETRLYPTILESCNLSSDKHFLKLFKK